MHIEFKDGSSVLTQQLLKAIDVLKTTEHSILIDPRMHALDEHIFIMRSVKYLDHALERCAFVNAPQKVMSHLLFGRLFKSRYRAAHRVNTLEHLADSAILSRGIHPLQNDQQAALTFC